MKRFVGTFRPENYPCPDDVNEAYFPNMSVGNPLRDLDEARRIVEALQSLPLLTQPLLTPNAQSLLSQKTDPTQDDLQVDAARAQKRAANYQRRLGRQREKERATAAKARAERKVAKRARETVEASEASDSETEPSDDDISLADESDNIMDVEDPEVAAAAAQEILEKQRRQQHVAEEDQAEEILPDITDTSKSGGSKEDTEAADIAYVEVRAQILVHWTLEGAFSKGNAPERLAYRSLSPTYIIGILQLPSMSTPSSGPSTSSANVSQQSRTSTEVQLGSPGSYREISPVKTFHVTPGAMHDLRITCMKEHIDTAVSIKDVVLRVA